MGRARSVLAGLLCAAAAMLAATSTAAAEETVQITRAGFSPLGLGIPTNAFGSATSAFITLGAHNVAYYRKVHGRRTLFHVRGIILPKRCPPGGWPVASRFKFEDGSTVLATRSVSCPRR